MKRKNTLIIILLLAVLLVIAGWKGLEYRQTGKLLKVQGFNPNGNCLSLSPGCAYCTGKIVNDGCFVTHDQLAEMQRYDSSTKAE